MANHAPSKHHNNKRNVLFFLYINNKQTTNMKKINAKKLNQFYMSGNNSQEMKSLVHNAIDQFVHSADAKNPVAIALLEDLGLLTEA
jgi:hypothetical protein